MHENLNIFILIRVIKIYSIILEFLTIITREEKKNTYDQSWTLPETILAYTHKTTTTRANYIALKFVETLNK